MRNSSTADRTSTSRPPVSTGRSWKPTSHAVIQVASDLDLVEVAACFANDDKAAVEQWINDGRVQHLSMATAKDWEAREPELWAVVVAPWVVVQERKR